MRTVKRLTGPAQLGNTAATKYTTPTGGKAVIRHIHVNNPSGGAVTFTCSIGADAAGTRLFDAFSIAAGGSLDHHCNYPLDSTEIFQAYAGTAAAITLTVGGEEYSA